MQTILSQILDQLQTLFRDNFYQPGNIYIYIIKEFNILIFSGSYIILVPGFVASSHVTHVDSLCCLPACLHKHGLGRRGVGRFFLVQKGSSNHQNRHLPDGRAQTEKVSVCSCVGGVNANNFMQLAVKMVPQFSPPPS